MSFTWLNKQGVASDRGFSLQRAGRFVYEYREHERVMQLAGEAMYAGLLAGQFGFSFNETWRTVRWQEPYHFEQITLEHRLRIVANIHEAMAFMGGKAEFD